MEVIISSANIEKLQELLDCDDDLEESEKQKKIEANVNSIIGRFIESVLSFFGKTQ